MTNFLSVLIPFLIFKSRNNCYTFSNTDDKLESSQIIEYLWFPTKRPKVYAIWEFTRRHKCTREMQTQKAGQVFLPG